MLKELLAVLFSLTCVQCQCPDVLGDAGYSLDVLKGLTFITISGNTTYYINLCGPAPDCYRDGSSKISSCKHTSEHTTALGVTDNVTVTAREGYISVVYEGVVTTHLTLTCGNSLGRPEVQLDNTTHIFFVWQTLAACKDHTVTGQVPCYTYSSRLELYDLAGLVGTNYNIVLTDGNTKSIYFSVCGPVTGTNSCNGGAACHIDPKIGARDNIGDAMEGPHASSQGLVLSYRTAAGAGSQCSSINTVISFICSPQSQSPPELIVTGTPCTYNIIWRTDHACPVQQVHDIGCKLQARGVSYDLTPLMDKDYTAEDSGHTYTMAVCRPMLGTCKGVASSGCQASKGDPTKAWPMGSYTAGSLVYNDEGITASYTGGQSCSSGQVRATKILFVCDKDAGYGAPEVAEEIYCFYSFIWRTQYACPTTKSTVCSKYGSDGELYDLSSLYNTTLSPLSSLPLILSVCGELKECPGASLCRKNGTEYLPLASTSEHFSLLSDKSIILTYEGAGECKHTKDAVVRIELTCKQGDYSSTPLLISSSPCNYFFSWATAAACPAHDVTGTGCQIKDDVTGLSFDLNSLSATPHDLMAGSTVLSLRVCQPLTESQCGDNVSACKKDLNVGTTNTNLMYKHRSLLAQYEGSICEASNGQQRYRTFVEFQCGSSGVNDSVMLIEANACTYYVTWSTPEACPQYPVQCAVSDTNNRYDLDPLYTKGNIVWSGMLNNTQTALYVRACGQLVPGTGCDHSAGVCAVTAGGAMSLGRVTSPLTLSSGVLSLSYSHGDHICTDSNLQARSEIEFRCDTVSKEDKVESATFNDRYCLYIIVVSSPLGCTERQSEGKNCSVAEPTTGAVYDFSYLTKDVSFKNGLSNFNLRLCAPLTAGCGDDSKAGACEIVNGNEISLGASSTSLTLEGGVFSITYEGGDACGGGVDKKSVIIIRCSREGDKEPVYLNHDAESCTYHFMWLLAAACPPHDLTCKTIDNNLKEYDLTGLRRDSSWSVSSEGTRYMFNVCAESELCGEGSSACMTTDGGSVTSLGRLSGEPVVSSEGVVELTYHHGAVCSTGDVERRWTTTILFICSRGSESAPVIKADFDSCRVTIEWHSLHACPATYVSGDNCTVTDPVSGNVYDLWGIGDKDFTFNVKEHVYTMSFCKPLSKPCNGKSDAGSCQYSSKTEEEKSNGVLNQTVTYNNGLIIVKYSGGDVCSKGDVRETTIKLACDYSMKPGTVDLQEVLESSHCVYEVMGFSSLPCDKEVLSRCDIEGFDLSPLALTRGNWLERKGNHSWSLNVCRGVNQPSACPASTAVCMSGDGAESGVSIGEISSTHLDYTDSILTLTYTGADLCPSTKNNYKTVIQFLCNEEDLEGTPTLLSNTSCTFIFLWSTKYACSNRIVADGCKLTDTLSGKSLSLASLSSQPWTAHSVTASYDIGICKPLSEVKDSGCGTDSAVCYRDDSTSAEDSRGQYTSSTKLSASQGLQSVSLSYSGGGPCTTSDGSVIQYSSLINFDCVQDKKDEKPSFIQEVDCISLFTFSTPLVCPEQHTSCQLFLGRDLIDLSVLSQPFSIVKDVTGGLDGTMYVAVCRSLGPMESIPCPVGSAGCHVSDSGETKSLGSVAGPPTLNSKGGIELVYTGGASCELQDGVPSKTNTTILFTCSKGGGVGIPQLIDQAPCSYSIVWETSAACRNSDYKPTHSCKVQDSELGFNYDLTDMTLTADYYSLQIMGTPGTTYTVNICGVVSDCGAFSAVCATTGGVSVSLGSSETIETRLMTEGVGEVEVVYSGGDPCPKDGSFLRETKIILMCCNEDDATLKLIDNHSDCQYVFGLCSTKMCKFNPKECLFKVEGSVYDFSALKRQDDNWVTTDGDRSFYLNVCRGVNTKAVPVKGCADSSIACMTETGVGSSTSLGNVATRTMTRHTPNITLTYDGGNSVICGDMSVKTKIVFSCGTGLGAPVFVGDHNCEYTFMWKTYVACIANNKPVISEKCTFNNPVSHRYTDLGIGKTSHVAETGRGSVYVAPCGTTLTFPKPCRGGSVCVVDLFNGMSTNIVETRVQVLASDSSADMIVSSSTPCSDKLKGTWSAVIMYQCNLTAPSEGLWSYEGMSQCHVLVGVQSPDVCPTMAQVETHHTLFIVLMSGLAFGFALVILYGLSSGERRSKLMRKIRALAPVRKSPGPPMVYQRVKQLREQELMSDSDEEIVGL